MEKSCLRIVISCIQILFYGYIPLEHKKESPLHKSKNPSNHPSSSDSDDSEVDFYIVDIPYDKK